MKIVVRWTRGICQAFRPDKPELKTEGKSEEEALGKFVRQHPQYFLISGIEREIKPA